jgi:hypothetical protein
MSRFKNKKIIGAFIISILIIGISCFFIFRNFNSIKVNAQIEGCNPDSHNVRGWGVIFEDIDWLDSTLALSCTYRGAGVEIWEDASYPFNDQSGLQVFYPIDMGVKVDWSGDGPYNVTGNAWNLLGIGMCFGSTCTELGYGVPPGETTAWAIAEETDEQNVYKLSGWGKLIGRNDDGFWTDGYGDCGWVAFQADQCNGVTFSGCWGNSNWQDVCGEGWGTKI